MMTARIAGIGAYVPENLITNDDLAKIVDTNDEWIRTRTGIRERRISSGEGTRHLAAKAAERALAAAGVAPEELDIIMAVTLYGAKRVYRDRKTQPFPFFPGLCFIPA